MTTAPAKKSTGSSGVNENIEKNISSPGYETAVVSGTELFSRQLSFQTVTLRPSGSENSRNIIVIPAHTLYGNYPPKIAESEVKRS